MNRQSWTKYLENIETSVYLNLLERATNSSVPSVFLVLLAVKKTLEEPGGPHCINLGWVGGGWYAKMDFADKSITGKSKFSSRHKRSPEDELFLPFATPGVSVKSKNVLQPIEIWNNFFKLLPVFNNQEQENLIESFSACAYTFKENNFILASFETIFIAQMEGVLEKIILEDNLRNVLPKILPKEERVGSLRSSFKKV